MFIDYSTAVLQRYHDLSASAQLSSNLRNPTTANLKNECKLLAATSLRRKDEPALRVFFEVTGEGVNYIKVIEQTHPDRFKPLSKLLKGEIKKSNDKNFELLAWLIAFEPRPYDPQKRYEVAKNVETREEPTVQVAEQTATTDATIQPLIEYSIPNSRRIWTQRIVIFVLACVAIGLSAYFFDKRSAASSFGTTGGQWCMYWTGDHYERANCNEKLKGGIQLLAYDSALVDGFRLVTRQDTVTAYSIGKMWYLKRKKKYDLFTAPGIHPEYHDSLHPLTMHIINQLPNQPTKD